MNHPRLLLSASLLILVGCADDAAPGGEDPGQTTAATSGPGETSSGDASEGTSGGTGSEGTGSEGTGSEGTGSEGTGSEGTGSEGGTPDETDVSEEGLIMNEEGSTALDTGDTPMLPSDPDCPPVETFIDVSRGSAGNGYPAPELAVFCEADTLVVRGNGIPNFQYVNVTPNGLSSQDIEYRIPLSPTPSSDKDAVPLGGAVAVTVNGLPIFGPTEAPDFGYQDPLLDGLLDFCNGHTAPGGVYHFHAPPECLFENIEGQTALVLGYSFDGYPILAPWICEDASCARTRELKSSWQPLPEHFDDRGEPIYGDAATSWEIFEYVEASGDLDRCNGRTLSDGRYVYHATRTFPYFLGCYHGTPTRNGRGGGMGGARP